MRPTAHTDLPNEFSRVWGWDLLRGMCAVSVAAYHLMYWQELAFIHTLGSYGVYLFFILSGASLAYSYSDDIVEKRFSVFRFLWKRYLRLAPLYLALMTLALPWKLLKDGSSASLTLTYLSNATFLFGFFNPSASAVLVGGWSLGIEAIFYLFFPLLMLSFHRWWMASIVFSALLVGQVGWIFWSFSAPGGYLQNPSHYFQAPAFAAYFMGGCMLGVLKRKGLISPFGNSVSALLALISGFVLFIFINPEMAGDEIFGWRGLVLSSVCFLMVYIATGIRIKASAQKITEYFGDATYGLYLLHPVLFFGLVQIIFPRLGVDSPLEWSVYARVLFGSLVIGAAFFLAICSERFFENPVRKYFLGKHLKRDRKSNSRID